MSTTAQTFKHHTVRTMLIGLAISQNDSVAEKARQLLAAPDLEEACRTTDVGGFLSRVLDGDLIDAFCSADPSNRAALIHLLSYAQQRGAFPDSVESYIAGRESPVLAGSLIKKGDAYAFFPPGAVEPRVLASGDCIFLFTGDAQLRGQVISTGLHHRWIFSCADGETEIPLRVGMKVAVR